MEKVLLNLPLSSAIDMDTLRYQVHVNHEQWRAAENFLMGNNLLTLPLGRYEITPNGVFAIVQEYETKDVAHYECHRKYIDIQCVVSGEEHIYVADVVDLSNPVAEYDCQKDIQFFSKAAEYTKVLADKDNCVILFPKDGHMPCMNIDGKHSHIRKIVVKVPVK